MGVVSKVSRGLGVAGAGLALLMMAAPAQAAVGDTVVAAVTGTVTRTTTACTPFAPGDPVAALPSSGHTNAIFGKVAIAGVWVAGNALTNPAVSNVSVTNVTACVSQINPGPVGLVNQGTLGAATYTDGSKLNGSLTSGGQFVQAGLVAVALINTNYTITGGGSASNVPLVAIIGVAPLGSVGVGTDDIVAGPVVSA
jgi:hypothetical protein